MGNETNGQSGSVRYRKEALDRLAEGEQLDEIVAMRANARTPLVAGLILIAASLVLLAA
ncbi:hypothetical protein IB238_23400 [Rhizobium sp. ARZ01]|uniref:hypothetical protein n=1 Tax=Rhizobium sp. ARZ01 TaxID=2769313 RepID=UPI00177EE71A|nr:hypothetical protein [Rhizobium sp. ARZ01]MBD9375561.1 hypothetical protein [Rhizobium sp. ARZ01]